MNDVSVGSPIPVVSGHAPQSWVIDHPQGEQMPVVVEPDLDVVGLGPPVDHRGHVLATGLDVLDRAPEPPRELRV